MEEGWQRQKWSDLANAFIAEKNFPSTLNRWQCVTRLGSGTEHQRVRAKELGAWEPGGLGKLHCLHWEAKEANTMVKGPVLRLGS